MQVWPQLYDELKSLPSKDNISAFDDPLSDDVIVKSPAGVDFIGGSGDVLGMAHITKFEKIKILTNT